MMVDGMSSSETSVHLSSTNRCESQMQLSLSRKAEVVGQRLDDWVVKLDDRKCFHLLSRNLCCVNSKQVSVSLFTTLQVITVEHEDDKFPRITEYIHTGGAGYEVVKKILLISEIVHEPSKKYGILELLGSECTAPMKVPVASTKPFKRHNFVLVHVQRIETYYDRHTDEEVVFYTVNKKRKKSHDLRMRSADNVSFSKWEDYDDDSWDYKNLHVSDITPVHEKSAAYESISTCCRLRDDPDNVDAALLYIRDPWVSMAVLLEHLNEEKAMEQSVQAHITWRLHDGKMIVKVPLHEKYRQTVRDAHGAWFIGAELQLKHPLLKDPEKPGKKHVVLMSISNIEYEENRNTPRVVTAIVDLTSRDFIMAVYSAGVSLESDICVVGPQLKSDYSTASAIEKGFGRFFRSGVFSVWQKGQQKSFATGNKVDYDKLTLDLDPDQLSALKTAVDSRGFCRITGPSGSGKTRVACELVNVCHKQLHSRFAVCASNNSIVENIMTSLDSKKLRLCREFSKKASNRSSKESLSMDLYVMSKEPDKVKEKLSVDGLKLVKDALRGLENAREALKFKPLPKKSLQTNFTSLVTMDVVPASDDGKTEDVLTIDLKPLPKQLMMDVVPASDDEKTEDLLTLYLHRLALVRLWEKRVRNVFLAVYSPAALGSTPLMMSRRQNKGITHLIIENATQMTPLEALAVYCSIPNLMSVLLLGDVVQDIPTVNYLTEKRSHAASFFSRSSEFSRVSSFGNLKVAPKLNNVYGVHTDIVNVLLRTIRDADLKSMWNNEGEHEICLSRIFRPKNDMPFSFVHLENAVEKNGRNEIEAEVACKIVMNCIEPPDGRNGMDGSDIIILCHHQAQAAIIRHKLKGKGNIGTLKLPCNVDTVLSLQGMKSKVVILLTTKIGMPEELKFISRKDKFSIAFSRASNYLFVLGNFKVLSTESSGLWRKLTEKCQERSSLVDENFNTVDINADDEIISDETNVEEKSIVVAGELDSAEYL